MAAVGVLAGSALTLSSAIGPAVAPAGATTAPMVTSGGEANVDGGQSCALLGDGTVWCWGNDVSGQLGNPTASQGGISTAPVQVEGLPPAIDVSAGRNFTCAVDSTNNVWCWGDNTFGELGNGNGGLSAVPMKVPGVKALQVSAGGGQVCALTLAKTVSCWGQGTSGQLGNGATNNSAAPVAVKKLTNVTAVATGGSHSCALNANGGMFCWGADFYGQLGDGQSGKNTNVDTPVVVSGLDAGVTQIAAGTEDTCAILNGGDLKCWGENQDGQLGNGSSTLADVPTQVTSLTSGTDSVTIGQSHACAIISAPAPTAVCWGIQSRGVPGNGLMKGPDLKNPTPVFGLRTPPAGTAGGPQQLAAGFVHTCVLLMSGEVECWGAGFLGELGTGDRLDRDIPTQVIGLPAAAGEVDTVSEGGVTGCVMTAALRAACWGNYIGDGTSTEYDSAQISSKTPAGIREVSGSYVGACLRTSTDRLYCWGDNKWGDLGNGKVGGIAYDPVKVPISDQVEAVSTGGQTNCAVVAAPPQPGGLGYCWGWNKYGEVGSGNTDTFESSPLQVSKLSRVTSIVAGQTHTCAILLAGLVQCWGDNEGGELGDNSTSQSSTPVTVSGLTGVVQVALGAGFSCALTNAGAVYCWGLNIYGELGDGAMPTNSPIPVAVSGISGTDPAVSIAAADDAACAVLLAGQVECWGDNSAGELGNPSAGSTSGTPVTVPGFMSNGAISGNPNGLALCAAEHERHTVLLG